MQAATYLRIARRWWWLFALTVVLGGVSAYLLSGFMTPTYRATTTMLVVQQQEPGAVQYHDIQTASLLANTFSRLITVRPVLEQAIDQGELGLTPGELRDNLEVRQVDDAQLIEVIGSASDPQVAQQIANTVAEVFIASPEADLTRGTAEVSIVEPADAPATPASPRPLVNAALGAILALVACAGLVAVFEYFDDAVKNPQQVLELTGLPTVGRLQDFGQTSTPGGQLQVALRPQSALTEEYRAARTNLRQALLPREDGGFQRSVVLVTSAVAGEGKSTTVANLGLVFGMAGHRTLVVDADLRRPTLHRIFSVDNSEGLTTLLLSARPSIERTIQPTPHSGVAFLPAGPIPSNPAELLGSSRMRSLLHELRSRYDIILIDTSPALQVTDASGLATLADSLVVVARHGKTRNHDLRATVEDLAGSGCAFAGVVFNRVKKGDELREYGYPSYAVEAASTDRAPSTNGHDGGTFPRPVESGTSDEQRRTGA